VSHVTLLPRVTLGVDGRLLSPAENNGLRAVRVQQRLSQPTLCELTFDAATGAGERLSPGVNLRVGVDDEQTALFTGEVTAVEYLYGPAQEKTVRIRAYDPLHRLRKRQTVRAHVQVTPADLARQLAGEIGLRLEAQASGPLWARYYQHEQTDLDVLVDMTVRAGLYLAVRQDTLYLLTLQGSGELLPLAWGQSLLEARLEVNADAASRRVQASAWDPGSVSVHNGAAQQARSGRAVSAAVEPQAVGGDGRWALVDAGVVSSEQASALSQAELDRAVARDVTLWAVAEGDPRLRPGVAVQVDGVAPTVAGRYVLTSVTHAIDTQFGFTSELSSEPPAPRRAVHGAVVTLGIVSQIHDPANAGRVKVTLPTYNNVETDWLSVVAAGAGAGKGLMMTPDLDDRVLLVLSHGDPARSVVLGGLYDGDRAYDSGVDGGAVTRYTLRTPGGQLLRLDDGGKTVHLENSDGSYVTLSPGGMHLHATRNLEIEAPGQAIVIRANSIDFQRG